MSTPELEQTRAAWDDIAAGYDRFVTPTHMDLSQEALKQAGLSGGMRFLDIACGSGALSIPAAQLGARVTATDISPVMIERITERAHREGLAGFEARVMDGHALDLDDDSFDVTGSQYGVMLFPDIRRAVGEMVRVTRPGGSVLLVAFGSPREVEFLAFFIGAMKAVVPGFTGLPDDPPPLPFQVADPARLRQLMLDAGLREVQVVGVTEELAFRSGRELWDWLLNSNPIPVMLTADLSDAQKRSVREVLDGMIRDRAGDAEHAVLTVPVNIGIGNK